MSFVFIENPTNISFENQEEDEIIHLFLRRHWITNIGWILVFLFFFMLPALLLWVDVFFSFNLSVLMPVQLLLGGIFLYYMLLSIYVIEKFLHWLFNVDIVTNQHLVDIEFISLLNKDVSEIGLEDIEAISAKQSGLLNSIFDYGNVEIQTAAEKENIVFGSVPKPHTVVDVIQDLRIQRKLYFEGEGA